MQTIGERIRYLRETRGLSQLELAARTGLQRGNISHYERNKVKPSAEAIVHLASVLGVTSDWLLTGRQAVITAKAAAGVLPGEGLGEIEQAELLLFSEFLRFRQQKIARDPPSEPRNGNEATGKEYRELIREASGAYLPVFSFSLDASPVLPDAVWEGFIPLDVPSANQCFAMRMESDDLLAAGIAAGDLVVVRYRERPASGEPALFRVGNKITIGEWYPDDRIPIRDQHGQAAPDRAAGDAEEPVLIGRIVRVEKLGSTAHNGQ